jgi:hypothetical protein
MTLRRLPVFFRRLPSAGNALPMDTINGFLGGTATEAIGALNNGSALVLNDIVPVINNTVLPVRCACCALCMPCYVRWVLGVVGNTLPACSAGQHSCCSCKLACRVAEPAPFASHPQRPRHYALPVLSSCV